MPYVDEVGIEHEYEFEDLPTARTFRDAKRREEQRKIAFPGGRAPHDSVYRKNIREDGG